VKGDHDGRVEAIHEHGTRVAVALSWADTEGRRQTWAHVLKLNDGAITGIQDYASPVLARAAARLRAVLD
jgi:ketosteroid isomerase-like protein